jgi:hypothetical protein
MNARDLQAIVERSETDTAIAEEKRADRADLIGREIKRLSEEIATDSKRVISILAAKGTGIWEIDAFDERTMRCRTLEEFAIDWLVQQPKFRKAIAGWLATTIDVAEQAETNVLRATGE